MKRTYYSLMCFVFLCCENKTTNQKESAEKDTTTIEFSEVEQLSTSLQLAEIIENVQEEIGLTY